MTTTITIKHEGPAHHDVLVDFVDRNTGNRAAGNISFRILPGEIRSQSMWDNGPLIVISEVERLPVVDVDLTV